jgi:RNA polymerase sigma-70 factor (family 1)
MVPILEKQVLLEFQQGKHTAFERVFAVFYPTMVDFARRLIGESGEAEDISLVAFEKLFKICSKFERVENIQAYLYTAIRNQGLNYLRQQKTRSDIEKGLAQQMKSDVLLTYEFEIRDLIYSKVLTAIDNLPEQCGKIFKMLFIEELSPSEVAEILKISASTVYNQKQNALKTLRLTLGENSLALAWILFVLSATQQETKMCHTFL